MEQFDGKIKNKLASLEYHKPPVNKLMTEMFAKLDSDEAAAQVIEMTADSPVSTFGSWMWKIAASVVLLLVAGWTFYQMQHVEVRTQRAMQITHVFPDGSRAALNAGSTMQYNKLTWKLNRNLKLDGEAFFEVKISIMSPLYILFCRDDSLPFILHEIALSPIFVCTA